MTKGSQVVLFLGGQGGGGGGSLCVRTFNLVV